MRLLPLFLFLLSLPYCATAQQEPHFTKYMFNTLVYNPGYAGTKEYLSAVVLYRDQWAGLGNTTGSGYDGRPKTQTFSLHSTLNKKVGLGFNVTNDRIGARQTTLANAIYAYRIGFAKGTLSIGLQGGLLHWRANWDELSFKDAQELDNAFNGENPSLFLPDFGAGAYYYTSHFYAGASIPHLGQLNLRKLAPGEQDAIRKWAKTYRHFYITAGGAIPLKGDDLVFKPSVLVKSVGFFSEFFKQGNLVREIGAPAAFDVDVSLFFQQKLWVGTAFRSSFAAIGNQPDKESSSDSFGFWTSFFFENGLRIGLAYDYPLGPIGNYSVGSFELMMGYDFYRKTDRVEHPRYF